MAKYNIIALIVAAGRGGRCDNTTPKQYLPLAGKPVLRHSVEEFLSHPKIDAVLVVYNPSHQELYNSATLGLDILPPVQGGATRQQSVQLGLESIAKYKPKKVLIHDAARPMVDARIITDIATALDFANAVIPTIGIQDTIKKCANGTVISTIPREELMVAQTPQGFVFEEILSAHRQFVQSPGFLENSPIREKNLSPQSSSQISPKANLSFTDDASLFEHLGIIVKTTQGSPDNFKITTLDDLQRAELLMFKNFETRVGMGFDAHKFCAPQTVEDNKIMLCGVAIPHPYSLDGHSDADVGLHACVDAILGSIAAGDIGLHFPPSDPKWKGANSALFLRHANNLLKEASASIINLDITIICELPKISPYRDKMCETIAKILDIEIFRVSVKATTTEGMGFTGRREGIAAQAVANIRLKI